MGRGLNPRPTYTVREGTNVDYLYRVLVEEELGSRVWVTIVAPDANTARELAKDEARSRGYFDVTALHAERGATVPDDSD